MYISFSFYFACTDVFSSEMFPLVCSCSYHDNGAFEEKVQVQQQCLVLKCLTLDHRSRPRRLTFSDQRMGQQNMLLWCTPTWLSGSVGSSTRVGNGIWGSKHDAEERKLHQRSVSKFFLPNVSMCARNQGSSWCNGASIGPHSSRRTTSAHRIKFH